MVIKRTLAAAWFLGVFAVAVLPWAVKSRFRTPLRYYQVQAFHHTFAVDPHRLIHFGVFALSTVFASFILPRRIAVPLLFTFAFGTELAEYFIYVNSPFEWADVIDDSAGVGAVLALQTLLRTR